MSACSVLCYLFYAYSNIMNATLLPIDSCQEKVMLCHTTSLSIDAFSFGWKVFHRVEYSLDFAPSNFHAFSYMTSWKDSGFIIKKVCKKLRLIFSKRRTWCGMPQASTNASSNTKNATLGVVIMSKS